MTRLKPFYPSAVFVYNLILWVWYITNFILQISPAHIFGVCNRTKTLVLSLSIKIGIFTKKKLIQELSTFIFEATLNATSGGQWSSSGLSDLTLYRAWPLTCCCRLGLCWPFGPTVVVVVGCHFVIDIALQRRTLIDWNFVQAQSTMGGDLRAYHNQLMFNFPTRLNPTVTFGLKLLCLCYAQQAWGSVAPVRLISGFFHGRLVEQKKRWNASHNFIYMTILMDRIRKSANISANSY